MRDDAMKLAFIGCGGIAKRHVEALEDLKNRGLDDFVVTAACDSNEEGARSFAQEVENRLGVRPTLYKDYRDLLEKERVDAVDICLPHGLHHGVTIDALEAGAHVLCEKPLGITIRASQKMAEAADRTGKVLATAVPYRHLIGQRTVNWVLNESELIGKPLAFFQQYTRPGRPRPADQPIPPALAWRLDRAMSGGGMVMDSGYHYCDSLRYFFGLPEKVYAEVRSIGTGASLGLGEAREDTVFATFTFPSGVVGNWTWSLSAVGESFGNSVFYGSEGSIRDTTNSGALIFHMFWQSPPALIESGVVTKRDSSTHSLDELKGMFLEQLGEAGREALFPKGCTDGFALEIRDFAETVRGRRAKPEVDGWDGLKSMAICHAVYESALAGSPVLLSDVIEGKVRAYQAPIDEHWGL